MRESQAALASRRCESQTFNQSDDDGSRRAVRSDVEILVYFPRHQSASVCLSGLHLLTLPRKQLAYARRQLISNETERTPGA